MEIKIKNLTRTYFQNEKKVEAVKNITLEIPSNQIYGIIGKSGAGKSSLVRLISLLEKPDSGEIFYDGRRVDNLSKQDLILQHRRIGMIFQNFNLFSSRTASKNVAYPLEICGVPKKEINARVTELLELVGLSDRADAPVSTLSGGQKQRIAIARALANNPDILFCDEATSALDPQTTRSILELIRNIQKKMNLTVVMITHQMEVVRDACDKVSVLNNGEVVETGTVQEVFASPKSEVTKDFLSHLTSNDLDGNCAENSNEENSQIENSVEKNSAKENQNEKNELLQNGKLLRWSSDGGEYKLSFIGKKTDEPIISSVCKKFNIELNCRAAGIQKLSSDEKVGTMIVDIFGGAEEVQKAIQFIEENGVKVEKTNGGAK